VLLLLLVLPFPLLLLLALKLLFLLQFNVVAAPLTTSADTNAVANEIRRQFAARSTV
jgi:hypothetical protein